MYIHTYIYIYIYIYIIYIYIYIYIYWGCRCWPDAPQSITSHCLVFLDRTVGRPPMRYFDFDKSFTSNCACPISPCLAILLTVCHFEWCFIHNVEHVSADSLFLNRTLDSSVGVACGAKKIWYFTQKRTCPFFCFCFVLPAGATSWSILIQKQ